MLHQPPIMPLLSMSIGEGVRIFTDRHQAFMNSWLTAWLLVHQTTTYHFLMGVDVGYLVVTNLGAKASWFHNPLIELHCPHNSETILFVVRMSLMSTFPQTPFTHPWTIYIEIDIHFVYKNLSRDTLIFFKCPVTLNIQIFSPNDFFF